MGTLEKKLPFDWLEKVINLTHGTMTKRSTSDKHVSSFTWIKQEDLSVIRAIIQDYNFYKERRKIYNVFYCWIIGCFYFYVDIILW